ncbi:hypothetical protein [Nonomuraea sp. NPDC049400]|uniref:hypothetical protein n=1 Tax=Nonomuraea sp. NPDC049400 TaxID=3364352 RepID=UPI003794E391
MSTPIAAGRSRAPSSYGQKPAVVPGGDGGGSQVERDGDGGRTPEAVAGDGGPE